MEIFNHLTKKKIIDVIDTLKSDFNRRKSFNDDFFNLEINEDVCDGNIMYQLRYKLSNENGKSKHRLPGKLSTENIISHFENLRDLEKFSNKGLVKIYFDVRITLHTLKVTEIELEDHFCHKNLYRIINKVKDFVKVFFYFTFHDIFQNHKQIVENFQNKIKEYYEPILEIVNDDDDIFYNNDVHDGRYILEKLLLDIRNYTDYLSIELKQKDIELDLECSEVIMLNTFTDIILYLYIGNEFTDNSSIKVLIEKFQNIVSYNFYDQLILNFKIFLNFKNENIEDDYSKDDINNIFELAIQFINDTSPCFQSNIIFGCSIFNYSEENEQRENLIEKYLEIPEIKWENVNYNFCYPNFE